MTTTDTIYRPGARYTNDERVTADPDGTGFTVHHSGVVYRVEQIPPTLHDTRPQTPGWAIFDGVDFLQTAGGFAVGIATADLAIGAIIGDPR